MAKPLHSHVDTVLEHNANTIKHAYSLKYSWRRFWDELSKIWDNWLLNAGDYRLREAILHAQKNQKAIAALKQLQKTQKEISGKEAIELEISPKDISSPTKSPLSANSNVSIPIEEALSNLQQNITVDQVKRFGFKNKTFGFGEHANVGSAPLGFWEKMRLYFDTGSASLWESRFLKISKAIGVAFFILDIALVTAQRTLYSVLDTIEWAFRFVLFKDNERKTISSTKFVAKEKFFLSTALIPTSVLLSALFYLIAPVTFPYMLLTLTAISLVVVLAYWAGFVAETWKRVELKTTEKIGISAGSFILSPVFAVVSFGYYAFATLRSIATMDKTPNDILKTWRPSRYVNLPETQVEADIVSENNLNRPYKNAVVMQILKGVIAMPFLIVRVLLFSVYKLLFDVSGESARWLNVFRASMGAAALTLGIVGSVMLGWSFSAIALPLILTGAPFFLFGLFYLITKWRNDYPEKISDPNSDHYFVRRQVFLKHGGLAAEYAVAKDVKSQKVPEVEESKESKESNPSEPVKQNKQEDGVYNGPMYTVIQVEKRGYEIFSKASPKKSFFSLPGKNQPYKKTFYVKQIGVPDAPVYDIYCTYEFNFWDRLRVGHRAITLRYSWNEESQNYKAVSASKSGYRGGPEDSLGLNDALRDLMYVFSNRAYSDQKLSVLSKQEAFDVTHCIRALDTTDIDRSLAVSGMGYVFTEDDDRPTCYSVQRLPPDKDASCNIPGTGKRAVFAPILAEDGKKVGVSLITQPGGNIEYSDVIKNKSKMSSEDHEVSAFANLSSKDIEPYKNIKMNDVVTIEDLHDQLQSWKKRRGGIKNEQYEVLKDQYLAMLEMLSGHEKLQLAKRKMIGAFLEGSDIAFCKGINIMRKAVNAEVEKWKRESKQAPGEETLAEIKLNINNLQFAIAMNTMYPVQELSSQNVSGTMFYHNGNASSVANHLLKKASTEPEFTAYI